MILQKKVETALDVMLVIILKQDRHYQDNTVSPVCRDTVDIGRKAVMSLLRCKNVAVVINFNDIVCQI